MCSAVGGFVAAEAALRSGADDGASGSVKCEAGAAMFRLRSEYGESGLDCGAGGARTRDQWICNPPISTVLVFP